MNRHKRRSWRGQEAAPPASGRTEAFFGQLTNQLDDWIQIEPDGAILAASGKVELGTGVETALAQIVADELEVPFERVQMVMGDTESTPDEGYTAGSMTIQTSGTALRQAAAEARQALLELASERLDANVDELAIREGVITVLHHPDRQISYAELMGGKQFQREVSGHAPLKPAEAYQVVGKPQSRVDLPGKIGGQPSFITDLRLPGMLHARLVRPTGPAARLLSVDESSIRDVPGLVKLVVQGNFIGIVTEREEQAVQAAKQLKVEWQYEPAFPPMPDLYNSIQSQNTDDVTLVEQGDVEAALRQAARTLHATYLQPYHAHASIGPSCALADVQADGITVWSSSSGPYPLRDALAQLLEVQPEKIHLMHVEGAGSYGQNGSDDVAADAVILSRAVGRPVRVQWSREDEFVWEPKAPAMVMDVRGGLDEQGNVVAWDFQVWSPSHVARPRFAGQLLTAQLLKGVGDSPPRFSFGAERNAPTNYSFPVQKVRIHWTVSPMRASSFRSLGGAENTFANESFIDELAAAAGVDAIEFRLRYLDDLRLREVLQAAAERAGWDPRPSPRQEQAGVAEGRGAAFARYENDEAIVACIAFVQVDRESGQVRVKRIVAAHDCGLVINPDGLKNQIEGGIVQSLSRALKEEVQFDESHIRSVDWETYPILKFSEVPEIEVVLIDRPDQPAVGAGEPATVTTAAAVANAIFDATGLRLRQIPFTPERIRAIS